MNGGEDKFVNVSKRKKPRCRKSPKQRKYKKRKQKKNQPQMPHSTTLSRNACDYGQSFWNNYRKVMEWQNKCMEGFWRQRAAKLHQENLHLKQRLSQVLSASSLESEDISEEFSGTKISSEDEEEETSCDNQSEYEVTDEFMKFIETSVQHKASLNKSKKKKKKVKKKNGKMLSEQSETQEETSEDDEMVIAPDGDTGVKRSEEMRELYGSESPKIHGMETAMHLGFMRKCDKNKPIMWPVVPLSHSFSRTSPITSPT